jgi:hypothetical protein
MIRIKREVFFLETIALWFLGFAVGWFVSDKGWAATLAGLAVGWMIVGGAMIGREMIESGRMESERGR